MKDLSDIKPDWGKFSECYEAVKTKADELKELRKTMDIIIKERMEKSNNLPELDNQHRKEVKL